MVGSQASIDEKQLVSLFFDYLKEEHNISKGDIERLLLRKEEDYLIPISVLSTRELGGFEAIVKYLKENIGLSIKEISKITNRNKSTIGVVYHKARQKLTKSFSKGLVEKSEYNIPVSLLKTRDLSVLETIVCYLKDDHNLSFHKIAILLNRDDRTIWTAYKRANEKRKDGK